MYSLISWPKCTHMAHFGLKFKLKFKLNAHTLCSNLKSQPYSNCLIQEVCVCGCKSSCSGSPTVGVRRAPRGQKYKIQSAGWVTCRRRPIQRRV